MEMNFFLKSYFLLFIINTGCHSLNGNRVVPNRDSVIKRTEYLINYSKGLPIDTLLSSIIFFKDKHIPIREERYYKGKRVSITKYKNKATLKPPSNYNDSILYVFADKIGTDSFQYTYFNGLLVEKKLFNEYGGIVRDVSYGIDSLTNKDSVLKEFVYRYQKNRIISESCFINKELEYTLDYKYDDNGIVVEKYYSFERCCDKGQAIPIDEIRYEYDSLGNLIKEYSIIDRSIKREYKDRFDGYFNQVVVTVYKYDRENRILKKCVFAENFSTDIRIPMDSLFQPKLMTECYLYDYKN